MTWNGTEGEDVAKIKTIYRDSWPTKGLQNKTESQLSAHTQKDDINDELQNVKWQDKCTGPE